SLLTERRILLSETATHQLERAPGMPTGGSESGSIPSMTTGGAHEVHLGRDMMESIPCYNCDGIQTIHDDGRPDGPRGSNRDPEGDARCARHRPGDEVSLDRRKGRESVAPAAGPAGARSQDPRGTPGGRLGSVRREGRSGD